MTPRRTITPALLLTLLLAGSAQGADRRAFPAERFAQLETPTPADAARWDWPDDDDFEQVWRGPERGAAHAWLVVEGVLVGSEERISVGVRASGGLSLYSGSWGYRDLLERAVPLGDWAAARPGDTLTFDADGIQSFVVDAVSASGAPWGSAWDDWSYATELLRSDAPIYDVHHGGAKDAGAVAKQLLSAIGSSSPEAAGLARQLLDSRHPASDHLWARASDHFARTDPQLAIALRGRFWPVGQCSMDRSPQEAGMKFADLCYAAGDRACYLQLQVRVMGDAVGTRTAWSSYGEASFPTYVERIGEIGVDTERFLMGLVFSYDTQESRAVALGPSRLARAMLETGQGQRFDALLSSYAQGVALDDVNRHQATTTLAWLRIRQQRDDPTRADEAGTDVLGTMRAHMDLAPMSERWVDAQLLSAQR